MKYIPLGIRMLTRTLYIFYRQKNGSPPCVGVWPKPITKNTKKYKYKRFQKQISKELGLRASHVDVTNPKTPYPKWLSKCPL